MHKNSVRKLCNLPFNKNSGRCDQQRPAEYLCMNRAKENPPGFSGRVRCLGGVVELDQPGLGRPLVARQLFGRNPCPVHVPGDHRKQLTVSIKSVSTSHFFLPFWFERYPSSLCSYYSTWVGVCQPIFKNFLSKAPFHPKYFTIFKRRIKFFILSPSFERGG